VNGMRSNVDVPLSDEDFDALAERGLDLDRVFGALHAVLIAPGMIAPSQWLPLAFGEVPPEPTSIERVLRLYNEVANALRDGEGFLPKSDDETGCVAFAEGYASAAAIDRQWTGNADRWTFASPIAFLGGVASSCRQRSSPSSTRTRSDGRSSCAISAGSSWRRTRASPKIASRRRRRRRNLGRRRRASGAMIFARVGRGRSTSAVVSTVRPDPLTQGHGQTAERSEPRTSAAS